MKVLHVGIFKDHCLGGDRIFKKGLLNNNTIVEEFDYRSISSLVGIEQMNFTLMEKASEYDLIFIGKGETIKSATLSYIRDKGAQIVIWYGDIRPTPEPWLLENLRYCDVFFMSSAGETLRHYYREGKPKRAAFYLNPCDPDLIAQYNHIPRSVDLPLYTGTQYSFMGAERQRVYDYVRRNRHIQVVGSPKHIFKNKLLNRIYSRLSPVLYLRGDEYIEKVIRSKCGIGVSAFQDVKYYTSDRLTHYLLFGKLYLAYYFPGGEHIFEDLKDLVFYHSVEDLDAKLKFYLDNSALAEEIGKQGQRKIVDMYNVTSMTKMMLQVINAGQSDMFQWVEILS